MITAFKSQPQPLFAHVHSSLCMELKLAGNPCGCLASEFALLSSGAFELDEDDAQEATVFLRGTTWSYIANDRRYPYTVPVIGYGLASLGTAIKSALDALDGIQAEAVLG